MEERRPNLVEAFRRMGDFYMELKWDFQSWGKFAKHITDIRHTILEILKII
jgi:hypothetical protein